MPPSLNFFNEKEDARTLLIQLQIVELMIASCHETSTGTAGERFMWWPSKEIQQFTTLLSFDDFSAEDIAFFDGVDKNVIYEFDLKTNTLNESPAYTISKDNFKFNTKK